MNVNKQIKIIKESIEKYSVTEDGELIGPGGKRSLNVDTRGYLNATVHVNNIGYRRLWVHRLQAYQKFGDEIFKPDVQVRHLDGDPSNNSVENIAIGTQSDNMMDIPIQKRKRQARHASPRRFTDKQVKSIIVDRKNGMTYRELCKKYKTATSTLSFLFNRSIYAEDIACGMGS